MTKILSRSTSATMSRSHRERSLGLRCAAVELKIVTYTANTVQYESDIHVKGSTPSERSFSLLRPFYE